MNKKIIIVVVCACLLISAVLVTALSNREDTETIAAQLRESYPVFSSPATASIAKLSTVNGGLWAENNDLIIHVKVSGEWLSDTVTSSPSGDPNDKIMVETTTYYLPVTVTEIISAKKDRDIVGQEVLMHNAGMFTDRAMIEMLVPGTEFVAFVKEWESFDNKTVFAMAALGSFWLTEDGRVMSMWADEAVDKYSGEKYSSFKREIREFTDACGW